MGTTHLDALDVAGVPTMGTYNLPMTVAGNYFFVNSAAGSNSFPGTAEMPFATIAYAFSSDVCVANRGDTIVVMQGHAETISGAGTIAADIAGVNVIGLGEGTDRPELTFSATTSSVLITAANIVFANMVGIAGATCTNPFHVQAAGCAIGNVENGPIEWQDPAAGTQAARAILTTTAGNDLSVNLKYVGLITGGTPPVNAIRLVGTDTARIYIDFYGIASTAIVEFLTTACTNIVVEGYVYNSGTTTGAKNVVDTATGSTWYASLEDGAAGDTVSGGSGSGGLAPSASGSRTIVKTDGAILAGADPLFTITGGPIKVVSIIGRVTTLIVSTANGTLQATTTVPAATTAMSTTVAIDDDAAGTVYTFVGPTGVLTPTTAGLVLMDYGSTTLTPTQYIVPPGNINFLGSAARVGVIEWSMEYVPMSPLALVVAAA